MTYTPHKWSYNRSNGFWANCTCGYSASGFFDSIIRRLWTFLMGKPMTDEAAVAREKARQEKSHHKRVARHRRELLIEIRNLLREEPYKGEERFRMRVLAIIAKDDC
ncbi:MAG: hypothetical protein BWY85_00616 [Firmicutes bacterium ADurb.Bin506]|nr:MAG: hypothetical protein BWY85_00616 [Firmicutes bacterium ADurb.Bin506]